MKIKDIAQLAGVSTATVSNVINGNHHKVSQATIDKINQIIEEKNYNPSAAARSLASKESKIIGVVIPNSGKTQPFSLNVYNNEIVAILEQHVRSTDYHMMIRAVERCKEIVPIFSSWNADGLIILGAFYDEVQELESTLKIPTVYVDTYAKDIPITNVGIDDYKGGQLMAKHLISKGHKQIALVTPNPNIYGVLNERYRGFCDELKKQSIDFTNDNIFNAETTAESGSQAGINIALSQKKFTAIATMSDITAIGVMSGLRTCGLRIPEDVSIIGFDNLELGNFTYPSLTTVSQDVLKKCDRICDLLFKKIESKEDCFINDILDVNLIERQSVKNLNIE